MDKFKANLSIPFFRSIHFKIPLVFILLLLISLQLVGAYFIRQLETEMLASFDERITTQAHFLEDNVRGILQQEDTEGQEKNRQLNEVLKRFNNSEIIETQVLDDSGFLLATSNPTNQGLVGQRSTDPNIEQTIFTALQTESEGYDSDQKVRMKKYVSPVFASDSSGAMVGVINIRVNLESAYGQVQSIAVIFLTSSAVSLVFAIFLAFFISRGITGPLQDIKDQTERISEGNYSGQIEIQSEDEIGQLANAINYLSVRVRDAQELTEAERQRLDSVLKHMTDGVIATDRRGKVMIINDSALTFISANQEDVIGESIIDVLKLNGRYSFRSLFESHESIVMDFSTEEQESLIKGEYSVIQRESGFISGLVWVLTDITEHEKIERDRRQFVSNVSHELRTPLTSVRSYTEALTDGALEETEIAKEFLGVIQTETDRMIRMINDLLKLSRMDSGREDVNKELTLFGQFVSHTIDRFDMMLASDQESNIAIRRDFSEEDILVEIDQDKIIQVIDNILNNAIKYSPDGGTITIRLMTANNEVILSIQDQGLGVPQQALAHLFDRFYRVDKARSRAQGGSGLGLAISKEVVELHNGRIWANSIENIGTTFFIALPIENLDGEDEWLNETE
ncbi:cell wall metabolism sensor histidine kinase WalK [Aerococcus kribbianus]|uniref:histidine kinase n=1 Tax=Aerococcus kribbianus TaxID=2999064 RepID=A0A9X3FS38_9LACT|nr:MULTISPECIES: cell wall metabolism sensor histidine kinase WalK [unclassified Aerococcus]MCZ0717392.1 cell wall metabolism sensor histidine kinase WalK [Aerococcus sp. YH-aer221]MCZ0725680.1 cell wall metabolism sensor histidine kinase WalK [Aerococcus sp. YH-aer222]